MTETFLKTFPNFQILAVNNYGNPRYEINPIDVLGQGRYGMVMIVKDHITSDKNGLGYSRRAIKLLKPSEMERKQMSETDFFTEVEALSKLDHPHLPRIYDWGNAQCQDKDGKEITIPYYVMEYIDGIDLQKKLDKNEAFSLKFLKQLIVQTLSALKCCFENKNNIIHLDIKPDNILVVDKGPNEFHFVLTDFGKAKLISKLIENNQLYDTPGGAVYKYVHPTLRPHLRKNIMHTQELIEHGGEFDLYSIGRVFEDVYKNVTDYKDGFTGLNPWQYLINDLCYNKHEPFEIKKLNAYRSAVDAMVVVERIKVDQQINSLPLKYEYNVKGISIIRLAEGETAPFPKSVQQYVDTPEFQKLRNLNQLGKTDLVYPSATHTRFAHSAGSYFRCLFYISALQHHPLFSYLYSEEEIECLYLTALLHDVGHYPFAHYFEEIEGLKKKLKVKHEALTVKILTDELSIKKSLQNEFSEKLNRLKVKLIEQHTADVPSLGELVLKNGKLTGVQAILEGKEKFRLFKDIISGPIDCDKLDYLIRDSRQTGVPYSKSIDLERYYYSLTIDTDFIKNDTEGLAEVRLGVYAKGRSAVESIISARYNMFSEVYWHKSCRAATAMIKDALWYAQANISQEEFEWAGMMFNDEDFLLWLGEKIPDSQIAIDLLGGLKLGFHRALYKRIRTFSKYWKEPKKQDIFNLITKKLGSNFGLIHKYKNELIKQLNAAGKKKYKNAWYQIKHHHIIIDIPNLDQDTHSSLNIKYPPSIRGKQFYNLKDISSLSDSIYDSFSTTTKKVRFFCYGKVQSQIVGLGETVDDCIFKSLPDY